MCMKDVLFWGNELKTSLRDIQRAKIGSGSVGFTEFNLDQGTAIGWLLFRDDYIHVIRSYMSAGAVFPLHEHEFSVEAITLYRGAVDIMVADGLKPRRVTLEVGKPFYMEKAVEHKLLAHEDSWMLATLIPPDPNLDS